MIKPPTVSALQELIALGLIAAQPVAQYLPGGNADRRDCQTRTSWLVNLPDGRPIRLVLGCGLANLAERQSAFANACPALVPKPVFHQTLSQGEAFAELFIDGVALESAARESPTRTQTDFARICAILGTTNRSSTETARVAEWQSWTDSIESLPLWTTVEKKLLHNLIWPKLYPWVSAAPPVMRWSNGDFTSNNILIDQAGIPHLIDHEFAHETHFYNEDSARFHSLSPAARQWPNLFSAWSRPGPGWHLFFWLRQLKLESAHNSVAYLERMHPVRLGAIRRLSEALLGCKLTGWSVESTMLHHTLEYARWEQTADTALRVSGWCHIPDYTLESIVVHQGDRQLAVSAPSIRSDVQAHFHGLATAASSGFNLALPLHEVAPPLIISALTDDGTMLPFHSLLANHLPGRGPWVEDYTQWTALYDPDPPANGKDTLGPLFSVLVPIYNTPLDFLRACLTSVQKQHYRRWELCIVDDGSTDQAVTDHLQLFAATDERVLLKLRATNGGIARASNEALDMASGRFVIMLDHDDLLRPHALLEFARYLQINPDTDALYSDEDKLSTDGHRIAPSFKPDYSPEYLLGVMYVGHALCVRTSVAREIGGFDPVYDGIQDYEFFLRITEQTRRIGHVRRILYHWRQSPGSSALHGNIKGNIDEKQSAAVRAHLQRQGRTERVQSCGHHRLRLYATDNASVEIIRTTASNDLVAVLHQAALISRVDVLVLLAMEPTTTSENWLRELANLAKRPDSGLIAPVLLSSEGLVHESGWTTGPDGTWPVMRGFDPLGDGYMGSLLCTREVAAISPACFAVRRELMLTPSPACETWLDFCLRLRATGLFHRACSTAKVQLPSGECIPADWISPNPRQDPFFSPHFDSRRSDYTLARPPAH